MSKRVVWSDAATRDYDAILAYVAERDGIEFAERLHEKLYPAIGELGTHPERCRVVPELQQLGVTVFRELLARPYRVPFRIRGREVVVLAVFDGRRDLEEVLLRRITES